MTTIQGGKTIGGATVGMLMLKSRFPRIPGDGGNLHTWPFPLLYKVVSDASPERVVRLGAEGLVDNFIDAGLELVQAGVDGLTTNCGFLVLHQQRIARACGVPVATSALQQVPWVQCLLPPGKRVGVVTVSRESLTPAHLECAGARADTPVVGTETGAEFSRVLLDDELELNVALAREDVLQAGQRLVDTHPDVGAIVLECTNMPPYAKEMSAQLSVPVFDFVSLVTWFQAGLSPRHFGA